MNRIHELYAGHEVFDPTNYSLDRLKALELHPDPLVQARSLDELDPAAVWRGIVDPDMVIVLAGAPQRNLGVQGDTQRLAVH